jgi:hypothetical protein
MSEKKNDSKKEETSTQQKSSEELKDKELEDVSGGLFDITIADLCQSRFELHYCMQSMFGRCPRLIVEEKKIRFPSYPEYGYKYVVTCSKGIFTKHIYEGIYDL